ncbi:hypothetical protein QQP08_007231 [Theobroma cacao]|nr:hypothetical protein QQP08_007231 [Theobroma cacao]
MKSRGELYFLAEWKHLCSSFGRVFILETSHSPLDGGQPQQPATKIHFCLSDPVSLTYSNS